MITPTRKFPILEWNEITIKELHNNFEDIWNAFESYTETAPGGSDTHVQYNNAGALGGDVGLIYDKAGTLVLTNTLSTVDVDFSGNIEYGGTTHITFNVSKSIAIGHTMLGSVLAVNTVAIGYNSGGSMLATATDNIIIGTSVAGILSSGDNNVLIGQQSGQSLTTESENTAVGAYTLMDGSECAAFGAWSMRNSRYATGITSVGYKSAYNIHDGQYDTFIGRFAGYNCYDGDYNSALGAYALNGAGSADFSYNTGVGYYCGSSLPTGASYNTFVGADAGRFAYTGCTLNTMLGFRSGRGSTIYTNVTGAIYIGSNSGYYETNANRLYITNQAGTDLADGLAKAIIYGVMDATTANQTLFLHAATQIGVGGSEYTEVAIDGAMTISTNNASALTIGNGAAGIDYAITINGETSDGIITWMEDEDYFLFGDAIKLPAGTTGVAPLMLVSGTSVSTPVAGAIEFTTDDLFFTITTGAARKRVVLEDATLTSGRIPIVTTNGRLADSAGFTYSLGVVNTGNSYQVNSTQVVGAQQTGVSAMTNVSTPSNLDADTVTVAELADIVGTLIDKLRTHGLVAT